MTVIWSDLAQQSLVDISQYISRNFSVAVAKKSIRGIRETARKLSVSPFIGSPVEDLAVFGDVRSLAYKYGQENEADNVGERLNVA